MVSINGVLSVGEKLVLFLQKKKTTQLIILCKSGPQLMKVLKLNIQLMLRDIDFH